MTIAIDFDGVLHKYSRGWQDGTIYDPPMEGAMEAVSKLVKKGHRVIVFTTRIALDDVRVWLIKHKFDIDINDVTNIKPIAHIYIDDRAVRFIDWERTLAFIEPMLDKEHGWSSDKSDVIS